MGCERSIFADRPSASTQVRTFAACTVGAGCVGLAVAQGFRVLATRRLLAERKSLLDQLLDVDSWQRRRLSEHLHDEALQYVLAARMDLEDVRDGMPSEAMRRIDVALSRASRFLRATVDELRPVVLEQWDLQEAIRQLTQTVAHDSGQTIAFHSVGWPSGARTSADALLFGIARELLAHVLARAGVSGVSVSLDLVGEKARLQLCADGIGIGRDELMSQFMDRRSGLAAYRVRVEAAGGRLRCSGTPMNGTIVTALVPAVSDSQASKTSEYANPNSSESRNAIGPWGWQRTECRKMFGAIAVTTRKITDR